VNLDLPFDVSGDELDDLDRAVDAAFLREIDESLEHIARQGKLDEIRGPLLAAG
jgi:hypothetical protein